MHKQTLLLVFLLTSHVCSAQNLVPNGGFEQYSSCPGDWSQLYKATSWTTPTTNIIGVSGTPDYFNQCGTLPMVGVPDNIIGHQQAHSGNAYAGMYCLYLPEANTREYIEVPLTESLSANAVYHFEMYVNLGDLSGYSIDDIGAYLSVSSISGINDKNPLSFTPQINNTTGNHVDHDTWTLVSADYTASGGESFLIIGNFKDDASTDYVLLDNALQAYSYLYIDDVSLTPIPTLGTHDPDDNASIRVFPNPFTNEFNIALDNNEFSEVILYDLASRALVKQHFSNTIAINTEQLAKGIYLYEVRNQHGLVKTGRLMKE